MIAYDNTIMTATHYCVYSVDKSQSVRLQCEYGWMESLVRDAM